jgi:diaminopimelate epimerase
MSNLSLNSFLSNNPSSDLLSAQGKDLLIYNCDPGGNYTYIAYGEGLSRKNYPELDKAIRTTYPTFEQGGFIEEATSKTAVLRLQMAGGEFCGNAIRCMGALITQDYNAKNLFSGIADYSLVAVTAQGLSFPVEMSGVDMPLKITCWKEDDTSVVKAQMPFDMSFSDIIEKQIIWQKRKQRIVVVCMAGITHILLDEQTFPFIESEREQRSLVNSIAKQCQLNNDPAIGLIWYSVKNQNTSIKPVVWVREIDTCIYESACGSGTFALCMYKLVTDPKLENVYQIEQPSKRVIKAGATKIGNIFKNAYIEGPVSLSLLSA